MPAAAQPLTDQQRAALEAHGRSVSLAAGAGCGKTFVLTERFLAELDPAGAVALHGEGAELDQVIAITFTDAAAREMRDRIRRRCYQRLQSAGSDAEAAAWQWLLRSMDAARISTIHAFCTALLRTHAVQAGLDPQFEVLDAPAAELLRLETIDDRLRLLLVERNDDVLDYAAQRGLDRLRDELASFAGPLHAPAIARWREALPEQLVAVWAEHLVREAPRLAARELLGSAEIREMRRACDPARTNRPAVQAHVARLAQELREQRILEQPIDAVLRTLDDLARVRGVCQECDWDDPSDYSRFGKAATNLRRRLKKLGERKQMVDEEAQVAARLGLALVRLAADVSERLEASKTRRNQLEFDDLLARADRLLNDPASDAIRRQIARRTRLVMVDEFQDTNPLQVRIIKALCGDDWSRRGLFAVGDFKQSIYRFNGAQPSVSTELRAELPPAGRLSLTTNFRSQPAVLDLVNALFVDALPDYEPLVPARGQSTPTPAVEFLWAPGPGGQADGCDEAAAPGAGRRRKGATRDARAEEARWIARRIVQLLESGDPIVADPGDRSAPPRPLQPGDVVILLRALGDAQVYEEALREAGLSYYLAGGHAFYAQQEIFDILNLLRAV
ncbi:MAG TPA: UvrD-helicase domain-containing protein, partial [Lacipirellulaceae bacterium]|nr:UvrD-helicase domain-containing protein [Lacipirellulaceae bacterium]